VARVKAPAPTEQLSPWAVASVVFGVVGLGVAATKFPIPILPSVVGIVLAQKARRDIRRSRGRRRGRNLATAGWWLGWIGILERIGVAILVEQDEPWLLMIAAGIAVIAVLFRRGGKPELNERPTPPWIA
jgi:uncharacterized protein DUF4190